MFKKPHYFSSIQLNTTNPAEARIFALILIMFG